MKNGLTLALVFGLMFLTPLAMAQSSDTPAPESDVAGETTGSAQVVYLDPKTGRLVGEPPPGEKALILSPAELNMISTSHQGLVEQPLPGGGYMVDLQGRFRHMAVATVADDGAVVLSEVAGEAFLPAGPDQPEEKEK